MAPPARLTAVDEESKPAGGCFVAAVAAVAVLADVLTFVLHGFGCEVGENSPEFVDVCASEAYLLPLAGIACAVAGAIAARVMRRDWPWIAGSSAAFALALALWLVRAGAADNAASAWLETLTSRAS